MYAFLHESNAPFLETEFHVLRTSFVEQEKQEVTRKQTNKLYHTETILGDRAPVMPESEFHATNMHP